MRCDPVVPQHDRPRGPSDPGLEVYAKRNVVAAKQIRQQTPPMGDPRAHLLEQLQDRIRLFLLQPYDPP